jgi:hypothetical protein
MDPFGAINLKSTDSLEITKTTGPSKTGIAANFYPSRQLLHDKSQWKINIFDKHGISKNYQLKIWYNGKDVSEKYLKYAKIYQTSTQLLSLSFKHLRLLPHKDNIIHIGYRSSKEHPVSLFEYLPPTCSLSNASNILNRSPFSLESGIFNLIDHVSRNNGINPAFLAGLVAQESSFNSKAVSPSRAIGLTQITPLAQAQLQKSSNNWPFYPELENLRVSQIRTLVGLGVINKSNDWRLDEKKSLRGGVNYLSFLNQYWKKRNNQLIWKQTETNYRRYNPC